MTMKGAPVSRQGRPDKGGAGAPPRRLLTGRLVARLLQPYWRLTRGLTLGAQGLVINQAGEVLLIRHGYRPGWFFPGGGVERGETVMQALARELMEEAGVELTRPARLHGVFANEGRFPGDHITLFIVEGWRQVRVPEPGLEIAEQRFFARDALPADTDPGTRRRLLEVFEGRPVSPDW